MAKINRAVTIDGVKKWIRANTEQEYAEKLIALCQPVQAKDVPHKKKHRFDDYALTWFEIYGRPHLATVTATTSTSNRTLSAPGIREHVNRGYNSR